MFYDVTLTSLELGYFNKKNQRLFSCKIRFLS